jgi:hypothetical protein
MKIRVLEPSTRVLEYLKIGSNTRVPGKSILGIGHTTRDPPHSYFPTNSHFLLFIQKTKTENPLPL